MHVLAEQVLAAARYRATKRIGLRPTPGGFGTPPFAQDEEVRVDGVDLVHRVGATERRQRIGSPRAAADFVGVPLGAPPVYRAATTVHDPDMPLTVDPDAAAALASWFAFAAARLDALRAGHADVDSTDAQLWPEHFDLAIELGDAASGARANYGASPGDETIPSPYVYVGPRDADRRHGRFAVYPFGAALTYDALLETADPALATDAFLASCAQELLRKPR
jgi:hypothetical protein